MSVTAVCGSQWGDEGKGKLVDGLLTERSFSIVARYNGGHNAGHTLVVDGQKFDFHILPSGLINPTAINIIGNGTVVHIPQLEKELADMKSKGVDTDGRLFISDKAHVLLELHKRIDGLEEAELGVNKVGTTGSGIGPAYSTKMARSGIQMSMIHDKKLFDSKLRHLANSARKRYGDLLHYDVEEEIGAFDGFRQRIRHMVVDTIPMIVSAQKKGQRILAEGANALLLDCDFGTFPFVTSSSTGIGGIFTGLGGVRPTNLTEIIGVVKSYATRVGSGPFPTEQLNAVGEKLQAQGTEFGVTTGRKRRTGWLDLPALRYSCAINCYTALNLTKLDVLDDFDEIKVGVKYIVPSQLSQDTQSTMSNGSNGNSSYKEYTGESWPSNLAQDVAAGLQVEYKTFKGWKSDITKCRKWTDLPREAQAYVEWIEKETEVKVKWIGIGPAREAMIVR